MFPIFVFGQYPIIDEFTSIGGAGEWYSLTGQANMGVENGNYLCYNIGTNYNQIDVYTFQSSNYGTQFVDDGCDSIRFFVDLQLDIRNGGKDFVYMRWNDGGWNQALIPYVLVTGTFYVDVPKTTTDFQLQLNTTANGSTNSKFVHFFWVKLDCWKNAALPVELVGFTAKEYMGNVLLNWITASEINNDYFEIYWSKDAINWEVIGNKKGAGNSNIVNSYFYKHLNTEVNNYYKIKQVDYDGNSKFSKIIYVPTKEKYKKNYKYFNILGQEVDVNYKGYKFKIVKY